MSGIWVTNACEIKVDVMIRVEGRCGRLLLAQASHQTTFKGIIRKSGWSCTREEHMRVQASVNLSDQGIFSFKKDHPPPPTATSKARFQEDPHKERRCGRLLFQSSHLTVVKRYQRSSGGRLGHLTKALRLVFLPFKFIRNVVLIFKVSSFLACQTCQET